MKYVVLWRVKNAGHTFSKEICEDEGSLVTTIQNIQIDPQTNRKYSKAQEEHWFNFGTEMGVHPKYMDLEANFG